MERICRQKTGLFPSPREIEFDCSCPDWASMCKHVAAVLYGVGARLDERPELLFALRKVDEKDLIAKAGKDLPLARKGPAAGKILGEKGLSEIFGIELAEASAPASPRGARPGRGRDSRGSKRRPGRPTSRGPRAAMPHAVGTKSVRPGKMRRTRAAAGGSPRRRPTPTSVPRSCSRCACSNPLGMLTSRRR
jgi:hypothetical protein